MARQKGVIKLEGRIGDFFFTKVEEITWHAPKEVWMVIALRMIRHLHVPEKMVRNLAEQERPVNYFAMH